MSDYVLQVNYQADEAPLMIELAGYSPGDAETAHQDLETEIEHARAMHAPVVFSRSTDEHPDDGVPIDPSRVTGVNLLAPGE